MSNKHLFSRPSRSKAPRPDAFNSSAPSGCRTRLRRILNEAGGPAYAFSPEHALAQYAVTGTLYGTFYASDEEQLAKVKSLASKVSPELVAKTAVYCRQRGGMKDVPAFLVAWLATHDVGLMLRVFPRVIDDARMMRKFVAIVRSGETGRKSFGSAPKRALREWFQSRTPETIFRQSIGQSPSMSDVIKMVRPPPRNDKGEADAVREALYGYLIGKNVDQAQLPALTQAFEAWKKNVEEPLPDVPFEMLTCLPLRAEHWTKLARRMTFDQLRQNLNTLLRHGVFTDPAIVDLVAERLSDVEAVKRSRTLPYQLLAAYRAASGAVPVAIVHALARAVEHAVANVPTMGKAVVLCPDVSASMHSAITGDRGSATSVVRCVDVAALVTAALLRKNERAIVLPFSDDVVPLRLNTLDSVVTNAELLSSLPSGGTTCSAPLRWLNACGEAPDVVLVVSDNQSWTDFASRGGRGTPMAEEWERLRARNPSTKLVLIDLQPYATTQVPMRPDVLHVGGFSDAVFDVVSRFAREEADGSAFLAEIESTVL
jgi:60 kDa SS-A/Ro ribonucleoprotein